MSKHVPNPTSTEVMMVVCAVMVIDINNGIQKIANDAYYDGVEDTTKDGDKEMVKVVEKLRDILKDIEK